MPAAKKPAPKRKSAPAKKAATTKPAAKKPAAKRTATAKRATKPAAKKPAAKRTATLTQRQSLAKLATRAKSAGDAATLLDSQFALAYGLADAIDAQIRKGLVPIAAHYRELRMLLADIVGVIGDRERADVGGDAYDKLSKLLSQSETNDTK